MNNKMQSPPSFKGLESALAFLAIVQDAKSLEKQMKPVMEYIEEAKKYFDAYNGIEGASKEVEVMKQELANQIQDHDQRVAEFESIVREHRSRVDSHQKAQQEHRQELNERTRVLANAENEVQRRIAEVNKRTEATAAYELSVDKENEDLAKRTAEVAAREERVKQAMKLLGDK